MTQTDLLAITGIGEVAVDKLSQDGITTTTGLIQALKKLEPPAQHIYSASQITVINELDLPTSGAETISQYTRQTNSDDDVVYLWETETTTYVLKLSRDGNQFCTEWSVQGGDTLRSRLYDHRSTAEKALTRWAYRPPEAAL